MPKIGSIGIPELLIILVVVLLIFGPRRLPDMAKGLGQSVREFRRGLRDMRKEFDDDSGDGKNGTADPAAAQATGATTASAATISQPAAPSGASGSTPNGAVTQAADAEPEAAGGDAQPVQKA